MGNGIYIALSGAVAQGQALDVVANNVANAGGTGFQAERMSFKEVLGKAKGKDQAYVTLGAGKTDQQSGALRQTGNPLDLAIDGDGYFAVETPRGARYTRAGDFTLDANGHLVNAAGLAARNKGGGVITVPQGAGEVSVSPDGTVFAGADKVGQIEIVKFAPGGLTREGGTLMAPTAKARIEAGEPPKVIAGAVEQGNFNIVRGVIDLVKISRTYEALHRMIESYRSIDERSAREIGGK